jgi:hypothetical protein
MVDDAEDLARIRSNADLVVEQFGPLSGLDRFGFDAPSVQWIEGFIERQRVRKDVGPEFVAKTVSVVGSYLGECIIRSYGGRWALGEEGWRVEFDAENAAFPFAKVEKQFANGAEDGIHSFFTLLPIVLRSLQICARPEETTPKPAGSAVKRSWFQRIFWRGAGR